MGTYWSVVTFNPIWLLMAVLAWGYYFTIMGTLGTFLIDVGGPVLGSITLAFALILISAYEKLLILTPFDISYSLMLYLVARALASQARPS